MFFFGQKIFGIPIFFAQLKKGENFPPEKKDVKYEDEIGFVIVLVVAVDIYRYIYICKTKVTERKTLAGNEVTLTLRIVKLAVTCTNMFDFALKTSPSLGSPL